MSYEIMEQVIPYTEITVSRLIFAIIVLILGFIIIKIYCSYFQKRDTENKDSRPYHSVSHSFSGYFPLCNCDS